MSYQKLGSPFLYDDVTGDIVGVKDRDGGDSYFCAWSATGAQKGPRGIDLPSIYIRASGDTTGATDRATINTAIGVVAALGGGVVHILDSVVIDDSITLASNVHVVIAPGRVVACQDSFSVTGTTTSGSADVVVTGSVSNINAGYYVVGTGIPNANRVASKSGSTLTLEQTATASGTVSLTICPVFNLFEGTSISNFSLTSPGMATIRGTISTDPMWLASLDADGSGMYLLNCSDYHINNIRSEGNHWHGFFISTNQGVSGVQDGRIGYIEAVSNGIRGFHCRPHGISGNFPGMSWLRVESIYLEENGRSYVTHTGAPGYDQTNGGIFAHVNANTARIDFGTITAHNEYGEAMLIYGNDDANANQTRNVNVGTFVAHNCAYGIHIALGMKNATFGNVQITGDHVASTNAATVDLANISEQAVYSLDTGALAYRPVCTVSISASITDTNFAKFRVGGQLFMSESLTLNGDRGNVILAINGRNLTVMSLNDPLGTSTDDADGLCTSQTPGAAGDLTINGAQTSAGASNYANPRKISITSSSNISNRTFTITGTDYAGNAYSEVVTGPNNTTVNSLRLFKTVTQVAISGAAAGAVTVGTCLSRPYGGAVSASACLYRGSRLNGIYLRHSGATVNHIENISFGDVLIDGVGYTGVETSTSSAGSKHKNISFGKLTVNRSRFACRVMDFENFAIRDLATDSICRGTGGESGNYVALFDGYTSGSSTGLEIGRFRHRHTETVYSDNPIGVNITANVTDSFVGKSYITSNNTEKYRINGARCVLLDPRDSAGVAQTVAAGNVGGSGSPVVWVPA